MEDIKNKLSKQAIALAAVAGLSGTVHAIGNEEIDFKLSDNDFWLKSQIDHGYLNERANTHSAIYQAYLPLEDKEDYTSVLSVESGHVSYYDARTHLLTQGFSHSLSIRQQSNRWYMNAELGFEGDIQRDYQPNYSYQGRDKYVSFPEIVKFGLPILGESLERGLNRLVKKRLMRTEEKYSRLRLTDNALADLQAMESANMSEEQASIYYSDLAQYRHAFLQDNSNWPDNSKQANAPFSYYLNPIMVSDYDSVLRYYRDAKRDPSVKEHAEIGYKSDNFKWRLGGQKQSYAPFEFDTLREKRLTFYTSLEWNFAENFNLFAASSRDQFKITGQSTNEEIDHRTTYARLNYKWNDSFTSYFAHSASTGGLYGKSEISSLGGKTCWSNSVKGNLCLDMGYSHGSFQSPKLNDVSNAPTEAANGVHTALTYRINF